MRGSASPRFQLLQRFQKQPSAPTLHYVFDVLWSDGERRNRKDTFAGRTLLEKIIKPVVGIQLGSYVERESKALFDLVKSKGMEGIVAKRKDSIYRPGTRTSDWLKIKARLSRNSWLAGLLRVKAVGSVWVRCC
jgi:bifunctional non-homologous end joining protein LigD